MMIRSVLFATMVVALPATAAPEFGPVRKLLTETVEEGKVAGGSVLVLHKGKDIGPFRRALEKQVGECVGKSGD